MQQSPRKHPLAVLRLFLGLSQEKMGKLIGVSKPTVQAIELLQLKLSEPVAERIVKQTNINFDWLLGGDKEARMLNAEGLPYSRRDYENAQGKAGWDQDPKWEEELRDFVVIFSNYYQGRLDKILRVALKKGRHQWVWWKVDRVLSELEEEFGLPSGRIRHSLSPEVKTPDAPAKTAAGKVTAVAKPPTSKVKKKPRGKLRRT
jgi:transcriptional regulator with XRE-family HTH domain